MCSSLLVPRTADRSRFSLGSVICQRHIMLFDWSGVLLMLRSNASSFSHRKAHGRWKKEWTRQRLGPLLSFSRKANNQKVHSDVRQTKKGNKQKSMQCLFQDRRSILCTFSLLFLFFSPSPILFFISGSFWFWTFCQCFAVFVDGLLQIKQYRVFLSPCSTCKLKEKAQREKQKNSNLQLDDMPDTKTYFNLSILNFFHFFHFTSLFSLLLSVSFAYFSMPHTSFHCNIDWLTEGHRRRRTTVQYRHRPIAQLLATYIYTAEQATLTETQITCFVCQEIPWTIPLAAIGNWRTPLETTHPRSLELTGY